MKIIVDDLAKRSLTIANSSEITVGIVHENINTIGGDLFCGKSVRSVEGSTNLGRSFSNLSFRQTEIPESSQDICLDDSNKRY